ncbi:NADPH-dependent FMN reductase [Micromonospora azadirachtae]|uniref:NADPH-dependent FMN reductase n=1 Tax=Micromonospora azadirachtae TaxID=1970735 RepID=A0ABW2ZXZ4_9ACTN
MTRQPLQLAVIIGSVRQGRFGPTVANWFARQADERDDLTVDVIDLATVALPMTLPAFGAPPVPEAVLALRNLTPRLSAADAFVVVTPEYNHSFPAALKNVIDWHRQQWHAKPVGFVSYGGISGGLRAVEALRLVFAELHAVTVRETVSFHDAWRQFDADGSPLSPDGCNRAADSLLDQLTWWAHALRDAKASAPYLG